MKKSTVELKTEPRMATAPQDAAWDFVDIPGAAALAFVSAATIRRMLTLGKLTRYKFFSRTLLSKTELLAKIQKAQP
jgi:hypothetical protein